MYLLYAVRVDVGSINGRLASIRERGRYHTIVMNTWPRATIFLHTRIKISFQIRSGDIADFEKTGMRSHVINYTNAQAIFDIFLSMVIMFFKSLFFKSLLDRTWGHICESFYIENCVT